MAAWAWGIHRLYNGNYHLEPSLRAGQVGFAYDFEPLKTEVLRLAEEMPFTSVSTPAHVTNWTNPVGEVRQWSLWNSRGQTDNTSEDFNYVMRGKTTPHPEHYPLVAKFARTFPDLANLRLNCIMPGSALSPHEEHLPIKIGPDKIALRARFHLPIATNPGALMLADDRWFFFQEGSVYVFNNGCVHAAKNNGDEPRYHLVWDMLMTENAYEQMFYKGNSAFEFNPVWDLFFEEETITKYAPSGGMSFNEASTKQLVFHP